jgi:DNA-binding LacI/PurR family transcriptional regulator
MRDKKVTLKDVAEASGCSVGAVSVVLNNRPSTIRVSPKTREMIQGVAKKIGYVPNYHAQSLHLKTSFTLGLVLGEEAHRRLANGFWAKYVAGVDNACRQRGYDLLFVGPNRETGELERAILLARQSRVDALIVIGGTYGPSERKPLEELDFPVVYLQEPLPTRHPSVVLDEVPATRGALHLLKQHGHRELVYVTAEPKTGELRNRRLRLIRELCPQVGLGLREVHLDTSLLYTNQDTLEAMIQGCHHHLRGWLQKNKTPTALAFFSDLIALGGMGALQNAGIKVPEQVSVFAFDDIRAVLAVPPLSVVSLELVELGEQAVEMALRMVEASYEVEALRGHRRTILAKFVNRESIGPAPTS